MMMPTGYNWRNGRGQYDRKQMLHNNDQKTMQTRKLIDEASAGSKAGLQQSWKKGLTREIQQATAYGDYTKGAAFKPQGSVDHIPIVAQEQAAEVNNRGGEQIYGHMRPDDETVAEEVADHDARKIGGENVGYTEGRGLYQAGHMHEEWLRSTRRKSGFETQDGFVHSDFVRATWLSKPLGGYDPDKAWSGVGHKPKPGMREIPTSI